MSMFPVASVTLDQELQRLKSAETPNNVRQLIALARRADKSTRPILINFLRNRGYGLLANEDGIGLLAKSA